MNLSESIDFYCPWNYQTLSYRKQSIAENLWLFDDFRGNRSEIRRQSLISERWARDAYQRKGCFKTVVFLRQESEEGRQWLSSLSNSIFSLWARYWFHIGSNYFDDKSNRSIGMGLLTYIDSNAILFMEQDGSCCLRNHQGGIQLLSRRNWFADKPFKRLREEWLNHVQVTRLFGIRNFDFLDLIRKLFILSLNIVPKSRSLIIVSLLFRTKLVIGRSTLVGQRNHLWNHSRPSVYPSLNFLKTESLAFSSIVTIFEKK